MAARRPPPWPRRCSTSCSPTWMPACARWGPAISGSAGGPSSLRPGSLFRRPVALDRATVAPHFREIVATEAERAALARRLGLVALDRLSARLSWRREASGIICLEGELEAEVAQSCVVTLEPVAARVADR